jgi:predicted O-methyltransferase YrrM
MNIIKNSHLFDENIIFEINDNCDNIDKGRFDLFNLPSIVNYDKILYLDIAVLVKGDINEVFNVCKEDILYVLEENKFNCTTFCGKKLFENEIDYYINKKVFTTGVLLFNNCEKIKDLFGKINEDMINRPFKFNCTINPYIVYNAFKYNCYNNKSLKNFVTVRNLNINSNKVIHYFPGGNVPSGYKFKIKRMTVFLKNIKDKTITINIEKTKKYIDNQLLPIIKESGDLLEGNIFMKHKTTEYTDKFLNKAKNISNLVLNKNIKNVMEIGFNSGFSTLLMLLSNPNMKITCFDLGEHKYTAPCYIKLKEEFGNRIKLIIGDSRVTLPNINDVYDLIHIDGGHSNDVAESDIINSFRLSKQKTILIMDDYNFSNLNALWKRFIITLNLKSLNINVYNTPHHDIKYVVKNNNVIDNFIKNKTYSWGNSCITFFENFEMNAFGKGFYNFVDNHNIIANFSNRIHYIKFNDDYTTFKSLRKNDRLITNESIIQCNNNNIVIENVPSNEEVNEVNRVNEVKEVPSNEEVNEVPSNEEVNEAPCNEEVNEVPSNDN